MSDSLDSLLEKALGDSSVRSAQDALVVALHACLLSGGFVCVAAGDEKFDEEHTKTLPVLSSPDTPALPSEWNGLQDVYALQYRHVKSYQPCLVKVIPLGGQLLVNALAACRSDEVYSVTLDISKFVKNTSATEYSQSSFTNLLQLITTLNKEIEAKLAQTCEKCRGGMAAGRSKERDPLRADPLRADPLRIGPPRQPRVPIRDPNPLAEPGLFGIGDGDRLPFGAGGGGMIFDPLRQGGRHGRGFPGPGPIGPLPPHHPPGARFDPVSPFGPGAYPLPSRQPRGGGGGGGRGRWSLEPDPDHLPPPGYDDMFS